MAATRSQPLWNEAFNNAFSARPDRLSEAGEAPQAAFGKLETTGAAGGPVRTTRKAFPVSYSTCCMPFPRVQMWGNNPAL